MVLLPEILTRQGQSGPRDLPLMPNTQGLKVGGLGTTLRGMVF